MQKLRIHSTMKYNLILAMDKNYGIGYEGDMLFYISEDLKRFKKFTSGNIIVMGRKTFISLPGSKELPNRVNIVLSSTDMNLKSGKTVKSVLELEKYLKEINLNGEKDVYLIGGGKVIREFWDKIVDANITIVEKEYENVDTYIPNILEDKNFELIDISEEQYDKKNNLKYKYYHLKRKSCL